MTVMTELTQPENRFSRIHLTGPVSPAGGGEAGISELRTKATDWAFVSLILALLQLRRVVVNVHQERDRQRDHKIEQH